MSVEQLSVEQLSVEQMSAGTVAGPTPVARWVLSDSARALALWALALCAIAGMYTSFFPAMESSDLTDLIDNLPDALVGALGYDQIGSAPGYISASVYALLGPALLMVFAVIKAGRLLAADEENGHVELELTAPVARETFLLGRLVAIWLMILTLCAALTVAEIGFVAALGLDVATGNLVATGMSLAMLGIAIATVTAAAGAVTGRQVAAVAVGGFVAVAGFLFNAIGPQVGADWMTAVSPMSWYIGGEPLINGVALADVLRPALLSAVAAMIGIAGFRRRDLMV